jgi:hypothetical protein
MIAARATCVLLALAACHDTTPTAPDAAPAIFNVTGQVSDESGSGIANAMVCILDPNKCQTTDGNGNFTFPVPVLPGAKLAVETTAEGYLGVMSLEAQPVEGSGTTAALFPSGITLLTDTEAAATLGSDGFSYPGTGGFLQLRLSGDTAIDLSGATVSIAPSAGTGPVYIDTDGAPNPSLTSSTTNGYVELGNLPAGNYELTANAAGKTCTVSPAPAGTVAAGDWPPSGSGSTTQVQIADNAWTLGVVIFCL